MSTYTDLQDLAGSDYIDLRDLAGALGDAREDQWPAEDLLELEVGLVQLCAELVNVHNPTPDVAAEALGDHGDNYEPTLIRDSSFEDYARDLAEDIGAIPADAGWPAYCIDWERAARELRMDYTSVSFLGAEWWIRAS